MAANWVTVVPVATSRAAHAPSRTTLSLSRAVPTVRAPAAAFRQSTVRCARMIATSAVKPGAGVISSRDNAFNARRDCAEPTVCRQAPVCRSLAMWSLLRPERPTVPIAVLVRWAAGDHCASSCAARNASEDATRRQASVVANAFVDTLARHANTGLCRRVSVFSETGRAKSVTFSNGDCIATSRVTCAIGEEWRCQKQFAPLAVAGTASARSGVSAVVLTWL